MLEQIRNNIDLFTISRKTIKKLSIEDRKNVQDFCEFLGHDGIFYEDLHDQFEPLGYCKICGKLIK